MSPKHQCGFCLQSDIPTLQGLRSHISQKPKCRAASRRKAHGQGAQRHSAVSTGSASPPTSPPADTSSDGGDFNIPSSPAHPPILPTSTPNASSPEPVQPPHKQARVEDVEDEDEDSSYRYIEDYPLPAGGGIRQAETYFERIRREQIENGKEVWAPYENVEEWELAEWLARSVGQNQTDEFLKLKIVSSHSLARLRFLYSILL